MAYAAVSKTVEGNLMRVQLPLSAQFCKIGPKESTPACNQFIAL